MSPHAVVECGGGCHLRSAFDVDGASVFQYRTLLIWAEDRIGTDKWLRVQTEHRLMGARGNPVFLHGHDGTVPDAAGRGSSRKPDQLCVMMETTCRINKVELFYRQCGDIWREFWNRPGSCASEEGA